MRKCISLASLILTAAAFGACTPSSSNARFVPANELPSRPAPNTPPLLQPAYTPRAADAMRHNWFPDSDMMSIGVYYYPEAWPREQWARDIANIRKLNLEFVHMGEFAWTFMEPEEGRFDFAWLDECVRLCQQNGLKVVLCTPSPTPPVWLTKAHPEAMMVDDTGRRMEHGTRQQGCWSDPTYRAYVGRITSELGKRYGNNPAVWGWQLDNELSHYGKEPCFCEDCQAHFRGFLQKKYGSIENLNRDWGNAFWSQRYQNFEQIRLPNQKEVVAQLNPHQILDAQRWFAAEAADYLRFQTDILRQTCNNKQWVTTNFMHGFPAVNPALSGKDLDLTTFTIYPVHGNLNSGPLGYRLGSMAEMSFAHDFYRSINGAHGIMELQPGQVNWGDVNPQPYPGAVHMWLMRGFAQGAKIMCTYRYREPLSGAELYHYGLAGPDGVTPTFGGLQYQQASREVAELRKVRRADAAMPAAYAARKAALLYDYESRWDLDNHKQNAAWDTYGHLQKYYSALKRVGAPVDVITEEKDFSQYPFLIVPAEQLVDDQLVERWRTYAENGGHLVLTCRTGQKDRRGFLWEGPWGKPILDLIGARIALYDTLPAPVTGKVMADGKTYEWSSWGEILAPAGSVYSGNFGVQPDRSAAWATAGTSFLATYADQYYHDQVAAVTRKLGKGSVTYIGVDSKDGNFEAAMIRGVYQRANVPVQNFEEGFVVDWRDSFWVATNFSEKTVTIPAAEGVKLLVGTRELGPAGVAVWQEQ